jgi:hypothetical protein
MEMVVGMLLGFAILAVTLGACALVVKLIAPKDA